MRYVSHYDPTDRYVSHYDPTDRYVSHYDPTDRYVSHYDPTDRYVSHYDPTDRYVSHYDPTDRYVSHYDPTDRYVSHYDPTDRYVSHYDPTDGTAEMFVDMVKNADTATDNKWTPKLRVDNCTISFKLDTGSAVSIISAQQYQRIKPAPKLEKSSIVMTSYRGTRYQA